MVIWPSFSARVILPIRVSIRLTLIFLPGGGYLIMAQSHGSRGVCMNRESNSEEIANSGLVPQLAMMVRALWTAPVRNTLFYLSGALFVVIAVTAYGQIRLNTWNQPFYDALSRH